MDFVPKKRAERIQWLTGISDNITAEAVKMGVSSGDATAVKTLVDGLLSKFADTDAAQAALDGKRAIEKNAEPSALTALRAYIRNWKTLPGYAASGSEGVLKLKGSAEPFDPHTYKPVITVLLEGGFVRFNFEKLGVDALSFYCRLRGAAAWTRIGMDTESPFFDSKPVAVPGTPEVREYMARGMTGDEEIGVDSDIVTMTLAG